MIDKRILNPSLSFEKENESLITQPESSAMKQSGLVFILGNIYANIICHSMTPPKINICALGHPQEAL